MHTRFELLPGTTPAAVFAPWHHRPWPPGLHSISCYTAGEAVLAHSRWTTAPPGPGVYRLHHSAEEAGAVATFYAVRTFTAPDHAAAKEWAAAVLAEQAGLREGASADQVHLGVEEPGVLHLSAWPGELEFLAAGGFGGLPPGLGPPGPLHGGFRAHATLTGHVAAAAGP